MKLKAFLTFLAVSFGTLSLGISQLALAATTVPENLVFHGDLANNVGGPLSGTYTFRLSLWSSADFDAGTDTNGTDIETGSPNYLGWQEVHTYSVTNGKFALDMGSLTPFPTDIFNQPATFLQVEVGNNVTSLELIDSHPDNLLDRSQFFSVPYAFNADKIDWKDVGYGANEIPYLDTNGQLPTSTIPDGTTEESFTINNDGDSASLQFGSNIANTISYIFTGDVWDFAAKRITNILAPTNANDAATKAYVDTQIGIAVGGGSPIEGVDGEVFTIDQNDSATAADNFTLEFGGATGNSLMWDGTDGQFEFNNDLEVTGDLVVTGNINGVPIGLRELHAVYSPFFENAVFEADGSDNQGSMYDAVVLDGFAKKNTLRWITRSSTLQDFNIQIRHTLPQNFQNFVGVNPVSISYQTEGTATDALLDITIEKEGFATDDLGGAGTGLNNNNYTTTDLNLTGGETWNAGDVMLITIKPYSKDENNVYIGDVKLKYIAN